MLWFSGVEKKKKQFWIRICDYSENVVIYDRKPCLKCVS